MKKRKLFTSGLSVMLLLGATNTALAQDDANESEDKQLEFEHAIVTEDLSSVKDVLDVIELAREEFDGVVTELDFDDYEDGYYYEIDMVSDSEEFTMQVDAETLEQIELDLDDDGLDDNDDDLNDDDGLDDKDDVLDDNDDLDDKYAAALNGDVVSIEEAIESTREYFDGIITDFDIDEDEAEGVIVYQFSIEDDHIEVDLDLNAEDLSIIEYEIDQKDDDSDEDSVNHMNQIEQKIQSYEPSAILDDDDNRDDGVRDNDDDDNDDYDDDNDNDDDYDDDNDDDYDDDNDDDDDDNDDDYDDNDDDYDDDNDDDYDDDNDDDYDDVNDDDYDDNDDYDDDNDDYDDDDDDDDDDD